MQYTGKYHSPLGEILIAADEIGLTGLWFEGQKYFAPLISKETEQRETEIITMTKRWLDVYFSSKKPEFEVPLHFIGTDFQKEVWRILCEIPYGQTTTYGQLAAALASKRGVPKMSAQAVGGAVGRNRISVIVPCHRVIGSNGSLTGYAGGIDRKIALLRLENPKADFCREG